MLRQFAKAALAAGTDVNLYGKAAEAAVKVVILVPEMGAAGLLWFEPSELPLC